MKLESVYLPSVCTACRTSCTRLVAFTILAASSSGLFAQAAPPQVTPPTREEVTRPTTPPQPAERRLEVEGGIARTPCALDGPQFRSLHFVFRGAEFDGLQGLTRADLASSYSSLMGRDVPMATICEIRDRASMILKDAGYIAAVQVPEQKIEGGIIHFQVVMAHLTQVRVRGEAAGAETVLAAYLRQLTKQPLFNRFEAERYLLLASDLPGYTVRLALRPAGTAPGEVIGDVTVLRLPAYADFIVQDGGSDSLGRWGGLVRGQLFGLTGLGDRTILSMFSTSDFHKQQTVQVGHDMRIGAEGLSLGGTFTYSWARPSVPDARVLAKTMLGTLELGFPFVRHEAATLRGTAGVDIINQDVRLNGVPLTRDRLRVAFLRFGLDAVAKDFGPRFSKAEPPWHVTALFEFRQGLHALGASPNCGSGGCGGTLPSRLEGHSDATILRSSITSEFRLFPNLALALGARAQYAWKPVLSFEEFAAGNYTIGRGYDPGALLGDKGFGTQAEIRYGTRIPSSAGKPALEGYLFWDHAEVRHYGTPIIVTQRESLDSVGTGARINFQRFAFDAAFAYPLTHVGPDNKRPDPRLLVTLSTRLWPWKY